MDKHEKLLGGYMKQFFIISLLFVIGVIGSNQVFAAPLQNKTLRIASVASSMTVKPKVRLTQMRAIKTGEKNKDELYMTITTYHSRGEAEHYRFPRNPLTWPSDQLEKMTGVDLWDGVLRNGESVTIVFSLIEQDMPPWNTDDLVGTVHLHLKNEAGQLISEWKAGNHIEAPAVVSRLKSSERKFTLVGEHGRYELFFTLK